METNKPGNQESTRLYHSHRLVGCRVVHKGITRSPRLLAVGCCFVLGCIQTGPGGFAVEGTVLDEQSGEALNGATVLVRALVFGGFELGRAQLDSVTDGTFESLVLTLREAPIADEIEVTVERDGCANVFVFDADKDTTVEVRPGGPVVLHINDPILVPPCAEDGDVAP